ncbi:MAG: excinuclease ABC subunit A [Bdellovibrionaceae bacterium]|nr:excinuclease ABC subunit A [Pseudobdellovibrionaceae bacterium]|tara:strand:- start:14816 stop:17815 length:3000 start_codon:yes stop_codon:yes gene_type:complete
MKDIHLWGVKQNNLKDLDVKIPVGSFTVICGPSGSGKSSLAFETLYAEGQRRYIDSLSNYAKQFLNKAPKPDIEGIENIPPAIAIEQKNSIKSSRSTVGTSTEVHDYIRVMYEKLGKAFCPEHHIALEKDSPVSASEKIVREMEGERAYLLCHVPEDGRALANKKLYQYLVSEGFLRVYLPKKKTTRKTKSKKTATKKTTKKTTAKVVKEVSAQETQLKLYSEVEVGEVVNVEDLPRKTVPKTEFYVVIDRFALRDQDKPRIADSINQAYHLSTVLNKDNVSGHAIVVTTTGKQMILDEDHSCSICNYKFPEISARLFSFNNPVGACPTCNGFGNILEVDENKVIPDPSLTLAEGAIKPFMMPSARSDKRELTNYCKSAKIDMHTPWNKLSKKHRQILWEGNEDFYGVLGAFDYLEQKKYKMHVRVFLARHKSPSKCPDCKGTRLRSEASQVLHNKHSIVELGQMTLAELEKYFKDLSFSKTEWEAAGEVIQQIRSRLKYLNDVGVGYLSLSRETKTLSGGEYQRLNLANQLGRGLSQSLYVLDEPTVGLHPRDNDRLIQILHELNKIGNTLVVVEHDHDVIKNASNVIEIGPGSGHLGGNIIFSGDKQEFFNFDDSNTVPYLVPKNNWVPERQPRPIDEANYKYNLKISGCKGHNLKNVTVNFPLHRLVTITGVSGSGKSSLVGQTLYPAVARELKKDFKPGLEYKTLTGLEHVNNVLFIDQSSVGKTARSSPVTYLKVFDGIRQVMAGTPEAKSLGYTAGTFSLNVDGGRCPVCKGLGVEVIDMMFMDDIEIPCDACDGHKFRKEILDIRFNKRNISDILKMTVKEAMDFFVSYPNIRRPLSVLKEVGLEYIQLGQSASTLSGGESQRLKLARELNLTQQRGTLFILDEPTTGLHFKEVELLMNVLHKLVDGGASVLVIEHNLEVIRNSDWIVDVGPEPGAKGGKILIEGPPSTVMNTKKGHTGRYLKEYIESLHPAAHFETQPKKKSSSKKDRART